MAILHFVNSFLCQQLNASPCAALKILEQGIILISDYLFDSNDNQAKIVVDVRK